MDGGCGGTAHAVRTTGNTGGTLLRLLGGGWRSTKQHTCICRTNLPPPETSKHVHCKCNNGRHACRCISIPFSLLQLPRQARTAVNTGAPLRSHPGGAVRAARGGAQHVRGGAGGDTTALQLRPEVGAGLAEVALRTLLAVLLPALSFALSSFTGDYKVASSGGNGACTLNTAHIAESSLVC